MTDLPSRLSSVLGERYTKNAARVRELSASLSNAQFWQSLFRTATASDTSCCT